MNIQINLIRLSEQRSASVVSLKAAGMMVAILVPLILILLIIQARLSVAEQKSHLELLESRWSTVSQQRRTAQALENELKGRRASLEELRGWSRSRPEWHQWLEAIQTVVPPEIQFRALQSRQTLQLEGGKIVRATSVTISGLSVGSEAEMRVEAMRRELVTEVLAEEVQAARVTAFREDVRPGAQPLDRAFEVRVDFQLRSFQ
jgi:Tfp pilus assembly protein PilN